MAMKMKKVCFSISFLQYDVDLIHEIEDLIGKQLEEYDVDEEEALKEITKVRWV